MLKVVSTAGKKKKNQAGPQAEEEGLLQFKLGWSE